VNGRKWPNPVMRAEFANDAFRCISVGRQISRAPPSNASFGPISLWGCMSALGSKAAQGQEQAHARVQNASMMIK
jgi:hypothetical protein